MPGHLQAAAHPESSPGRASALRLGRRADQPRVRAAAARIALVESRQWVRCTSRAADSKLPITPVAYTLHTRERLRALNACSETQPIVAKNQAFRKIWALKAKYPGRMQSRGATGVYVDNHKTGSVNCKPLFCTTVTPWLPYIAPYLRTGCGATTASLPVTPRRPFGCICGIQR